MTKANLFICCASWREFSFFVKLQMCKGASSHEASSVHSINVSSKSHFKDTDSGLHMHPEWCYALTDNAPRQATVSSHSGNRWQTRSAFSKTVYSFEVKEDTASGQKVQQNLCQHIPLSHILYLKIIILHCPHVDRNKCGKSGHSVKDSHAYHVLGAGG